MELVYTKCAILLILLRMVFSETVSENSLHTWECSNGQRIKSEELCDGTYNCDDKSDETTKQCLLRPCPRYAFQCAYGACITGNFKCNGIVNCADGSDETRFLCDSRLNYEEEMQGKCKLTSSMQCQSGECINNERLCDGHEDCSDGSDETVEVCSFLKCPEYSFRCGYGACIPGLSACDGQINCRDGSDEMASICPYNINATTVEQIPLSPVFSPTDGPTSTTATTVTSFSTTDSATENPSLAGVNYCSTSTLKRGISTTASCYYNGREVSCHDNILAQTMAIISCAPGYVEKPSKKNLTTLKCDTDGEWNRPKMKCMPECGTLTEEQKAEPFKPWEVTIFRRELKPVYIPACSGVIVSPKIVLTAATCFLDPSGGYNMDHVFYNLVEGYHNESYNNGDSLSGAVHNLSSITIRNSKRKSNDLAILILVNYFKFSNNLKPICLPMAQGTMLPFYGDKKLIIGCPIVRDTSKYQLEYLIASFETEQNGRILWSYVDIYHHIRFIIREIKKYDYLL